MFTVLAIWLSIQSYDDLVNRGVHALEEGQFAAAEAAFREAARTSPGEVAAWVLLSEVFLKRGNPAAAVEVLATLPEAMKSDGAVLCQRGRALSQLGRQEPAISDLERALRGKADERVCREALAVAKLEVGDAEGALSALEPLLGSIPPSERSPALNTTHGMALTQAERYEEAIPPLIAALEVQPRRSRALLHLGRSLQALERVEEAAGVYARGLDFPPPENVPFSLGLARCQILLGRLEEARGHLDSLLEKHPRVGRAWLLRGIVAFEEGRYEDSVADVKRGMEAGYALAESDLRLGMALGMTGRYAEAHSALDVALVKDPELAIAHYYKGLFLFREGEGLAKAAGGQNPFGIQAVRYLERSNALLPNPRTSLALAEAYLRLGQHLRAVESAEAASRVPELAADAYHRKALAHHELLEFEPAEESYRKAFQNGADSAAIYHDLGNLLSVMGRWEEAKTALEGALVRDPEYASAHLQMGIALSNLRGTDAALSHLKRAIELAPDNPEAWYQRGVVESHASSSEAAIESWRKALTLDPDESRTLYRLAGELLKMDRVEERNELLSEFQEKQRRAEAASQREERLSNILTAALKSLDDGDEGRSRELFSEAMRLAPEDPRPYVYLADLDLSSGRSSEALSVIQAGLARIPGDLALRQLLAEAERLSSSQR